MWRAWGVFVGVIILLTPGVALAGGFADLTGFTVVSAGRVSESGTSLTSTWISLDGGDEIKIGSSVYGTLTYSTTVLILGKKTATGGVEWKFLIKGKVYDGRWLARGTKSSLASGDLVGYAVDEATSYQKKITTASFAEYHQLANGHTYSVPLLLLAPLFLTDVVVFSKVASYKDKRGVKKSLTLHKLLVDDDVYDATQVR